VVGLIMCEHWISDSRKKPRCFRSKRKKFEGSLALLYEHIDHIHEVTGSYDHIAFGTDLDGHIKPALPGLQHLGRMKELQTELKKHYEDPAASKISGENALRVIKAVW
jgi:microsomal dipeptidase-like Zn-dependent dipeptidase